MQKYLQEGGHHTVEVTSFASDLNFIESDGSGREVPQYLSTRFREALEEHLRVHSGLPNGAVDYNYREKMKSLGQELLEYWVSTKHTGTLSSEVRRAILGAIRRRNPCPKLSEDVELRELSSGSEE